MLISIGILSIDMLTVVMGSYSIIFFNIMSTPKIWGVTAKDF